MGKRARHGHVYLSLLILSQAIARVERTGPYCVTETGGNSLFEDVEVPLLK